MSKAESYVAIIMSDDLPQIAAEETIVYEPETRIERLYKFHDGAIMRYEWRSYPTAAEGFNHRFSIVEPPTDNPDGIERGVVRVINHPSNGR